VRKRRSTGQHVDDVVGTENSGRRQNEENGHGIQRFVVVPRQADLTRRADGHSDRESIVVGAAEWQLDPPRVIQVPLCPAWVFRTSGRLPQYSHFR